MESSLSDGRIISGQLFTAFDEETKGSRAMAECFRVAVGGSVLSCLFATAANHGRVPGPSERYYGILTSKGEIKNEYSCVSNATESRTVIDFDSY